MFLIMYLFYIQCFFMVLLIGFLFIVIVVFDKIFMCNLVVVIIILVLIFLLLVLMMMLLLVMVFMIFVIMLMLGLCSVLKKLVFGQKQRCCLKGLYWGLKCFLIVNFFGSCDFMVLMMNLCLVLGKLRINWIKIVLKNIF